MKIKTSTEYTRGELIGMITALRAEILTKDPYGYTDLLLDTNFRIVEDYKIPGKHQILDIESE